ncbi:hypothetical protein AAG570_002870 [Ranatra chinensis]|uniref:Protein kinase domain-containing protein n=1 Tax=Ranatra chinensis TaxID=642074 RepID=A0ABD0Y559_9HEMI
MEDKYMGKTRRFACKVVDTTKAKREYVKKFLPREMEIVSRIKHPNIIHVQSAFIRGTKYFTIMRYAERGDLLIYLRHRGRVPEGRCRLWAFQLGLALEYLHRQGIAHRDIKCENVLVTEKRNAKLGDFGFARKVDRPDVSLTFCGSVAYTAPEVLTGRPYNGRVSDMWSLGVILFVITYNRLPFGLESAKKMAAVIRDTSVRHLLESNAPGAQPSADLKETILRLMEKDTIARWTATRLVESKWIRTDPR